MLRRRHHRRSRSTPAPTRSCVGVFEGEGIAHDVEGGALQALVDAGEAKPSLPQARAHARRREALAARRAAARATRSTPSAPASRPPPRSAARASSAARRSAGSCRTRSPTRSPPRFVEGTLLAAYRYTRVQVEPSDDGGRPGALDRLRPPRRRRGVEPRRRVGAAAATRRATSRTRPPNAHDARPASPSARGRSTGCTSRSMGRDGDRRPPGWARSRRSRRAPTRSRADHAALRAARTPPGPCSAWSARP